MPVKMREWIGPDCNFGRRATGGNHGMFIKSSDQASFTEEFVRSKNCDDTALRPALTTE